MRPARGGTGFQVRAPGLAGSSEVAPEVGAAPAPAAAGLRLAAVAGSPGPGWVAVDRHQASPVGYVLAALAEPAVLAWVRRAAAERPWGVVSGSVDDPRRLGAGVRPERAEPPHQTAAPWWNHRTL